MLCHQIALVSGEYHMVRIWWDMGEGEAEGEGESEGEGEGEGEGQVCYVF